MSIEQSNTIDFLSVDDTEGVCYAIISDHLEWNGFDHYKALQHKLNNYLAFIESGEIYEHRADAKGHDIVIALRCKHIPSEADDLHFLQNVRNTIQNAGFEFKVIGDSGEIELPTAEVKK